MPLSLTANAKINLGLRIVGRREDGLHLLHTLFQELDFGDEVTLTDQPDPKVTLEVTGPAAGGVPTDDNNLCVQVARLFQEKTGAAKGVHIQLVKRIPPGAGLGGGSSDAAAVLKGLNELWHTGMTVPEMEELAVELGADVPFFIRGGLQLGEGIGELLTPLERMLPYTVVLVIPPFGVDTAWAYGQFASRRSFPPPPALDELIAREPIPWDAFTNDFEEMVFPRHGQLAEIMEGLLATGAAYASLSGSGSAVYGLFEEPPPEAELRRRFAESQLVICQAVSGN
ncbi:MAG: 4-(cytidine 5'-diphospho)-2-C-methyl-D-erythritol kinase [Fidelibacterota bacterium]|nr:MAG: 4-(cytidine 5'-diphospho)-2-C-methyl-D-erythritol kinase [Candidatus Neomarinimicrobiota bacterium]